MNDEDTEVEQMRYALSAIANEMQKFQHDSIPIESTEGDDTLLCVLMKYKYILKSKKEQIKLLKQQLKMACTVAKTLSAAKENETAALNSLLEATRNQYNNLLEQDKQNLTMINSLQAENQTLRDKFQCFNNFVRVGYLELQNIPGETQKDIPILKQLQTILVSCGEYYANYHKQREKCEQLEQKNRFLESKLRILENNLNTSTEGLRNVRTASMKLRANEIHTRALCKDISVVHSAYQITQHSNVVNLKIAKIEQHLDKPKLFDLTTHFCTVKKLLHDQDVLIKDLKCLSNEISMEYFLG